MQGEHIVVKVYAMSIECVHAMLKLRDSFM